MHNEKISTKVLFCGPLTSPFVLGDLKLLQSYFKDVDVINLDNTQRSKKGNIEYLLYLLGKGKHQIYNCDVVYIWFALYHIVPLLLLSKLFKKRSIVWVGGWEVSNMPEIHYGNQLNKYHGAITRWCLKNSDVILIPSESYKNKILKLVPSANVYTVPHSIDESLYTSNLPDKMNRVITGVFAGKFTYKLKGLKLFNDVDNLLNNKFEFIICDGLPHKTFIDTLKTSKVYCQLSYTESFCISLVEAMACGCVPVVTDRDALPEIIGDCGIVVPYGNEIATAKAVKLAITMNGDKARERARHYSHENKIKILAPIIENDIVSVVIPSYNSAKWLPDTIKSIKDQTYKNIEIIIVDDCSTDNTQGLILSMNDPQIHYIKNPVNRGECCSSRAGFDKANGKYICRLSSDDMYANPDKIKHQVERMNKTKADWSYNSTNCMGESINTANTIKTYWMPLPTRYGHGILQLFDNFILKFPRLCFIRLFFGNPVNSSTLMLRKTSYMAGDKWSNIHRTDCDGLLLFNLLLRGRKGTAMSEMGSFYRVHPGQMSYNPLYIEEMRTIRREIKMKLYDGKYPRWLKLMMRIMEAVRK